MNRTINFVTYPGQVVKLLPFPNGDLDDYNSAVEATENSSPNTGKYSAVLDDSLGSEWYVFIGETQPSSWDDYEFSINLQPAVRDWTNDQRDRIIQLFKLDEDPYVPPDLIIPEPMNPELSVGHLLSLDKNLLPQQDIIFYLILISGPGDPGFSYDMVRKQATSDVNGLVIFDNLIRGATYRIWRGSDSGNAKTFITPDEDTFQLPEV